MNLNDLFMYIFLFIIVCIVILCVVKFHKNKTRTKKVKNTQNIKEGFRARITMDDVLDKYCVDSSEFPEGIDNYLGPWDDVPQGECSFYECPQEYCYTLTPSFTNDDNNYRYVINQSPQQRSNDLDGSSYCVSKQNNSNIYSCSPSLIQLNDNKPESCGNSAPYDAWYFNSTASEWKLRKINQFYNSNGDCLTKNVNYPYDEVYYIELDSGKLPGSEISSTKRLGNSNNTVHYNNRGLSCEMKQTKETNNNSNYWVPVEISGYDINDSYLELVDSEIDEFSSFYGGFRCKNGNVREYVYVANEETEKIDGTKCGFSNPTDNCTSCSTGIKTCYDFDDTKRSWSTTKYVRTNKIEIDALEKDCKIYKVRPETDIDTNRLVDTGYLNTILSHDSTDTDEMNIIGGRNYIQIDKDDDDFKSNCITTDYTGLCGKDVLCPMLGSKIYELIDNNLKIGTNTDNKKNIFDSIISQANTRLVGSLTSDDDENLIKYNIRLKEVFKPGGSNCEHCFIGDESECIQDLNYFTMSNEMCDEACPVGTVLSNVGTFKPYCKKCTHDEYFDTERKQCIQFSGCPAGTYFDPSSNIQVALYSNNTLDYSDLYEAIVANKKIEDIYFLKDNTDSNCKPCTLNTYMDQDFHTNRQCENCELIQRQNGTSILKTVNKNRTLCTTCINNNGLENKSTNDRNAKYVNTTDGTYSCESCPNLDSEHNDKKKSYIFGRTPIVESGEQPNGTCYKKCRSGTYNKQSQITQEIEINPDGETYSNCEFDCSINYFKPTNSNSCYPCPVGQDRTTGSSTSCTPCVDGYYNDVPGGTCKNCPIMNNEKYFQFEPGTTLIGSSNIEQCYYSCLSNGDTITDKAMLYGTQKNHFYHLDNCPKEDCFAGYEKQNLSDNTGYKYIARKGTTNTSKGYDSCDLESTLMGLNIRLFPSPASCRSGFEETKITGSEIPSISNVICCTRGLEYNLTSKQCECPAAPPDNELIDGYEWTSGSVCQVKCKGSAVRQFDNSCLVSCDNGKYVDGSSCTDCPKPNSNPAGSSNPEYAYNDDGKDVEGCYFNSCPEGYYLPTGDKSRYDLTSEEYSHNCIEVTDECYYYEDTPKTTNVINNNKIGGFGNDDIISINLQKYVIEKMTSAECIEKLNLNSAINDPYMLDYTTGSYKRGYCESPNNIQIPQYKQKFNQGVFEGEERLTNQENAIFCCPSTEEGSIGYKIGQRLQYKCCPMGQKIFIDAENVATCANYDCPSPNSIQNHVYYSDAAKASIPDNQFLPVPFSNCRIECLSSYTWNEKDSNCALYDVCDPIYVKQDNLSSENKGLSVYKLEEQSPGFNCDEGGDYYEKLGSHSCIQEVDERDNSTLQYCCPSGFTYDREKNDCMRTFNVCHGGA